MLPNSIRKGIISDICTKWYRFTNYITNNIPKKRRGKNRRTTFTINANSINVTKDHKFIRLPNEFNNILIAIRTKDIIKKSDIIELRVTPDNGKFNIDIKYKVSYANNIINGNKVDRVAGIDLGVDNLIAMATNVCSRPILIKGGRITSINKYYNHLMSNKKINSNSYKRLNKNRINKINNYLNHCANLVVDYLVLSNIRKLYIGYSKLIKTGFMKFKEDPNFITIDYDYLIDQIIKKCYKYNIMVKLVDEYYTSNCCALTFDNINKSYSDPSRRISNRLFDTKQFGIISSDINSAFNIIKKGYNGPDHQILLSTIFRLLSNQESCGRLMVSPLVITDILHFSISNDIIHPEGLYIDLWSKREMWHNQQPKPFSDRETRKGEMARMRILIPG